MCRHLHDGNLGLELGALVLHLRWMDAQARTGGILGLKKDCDLLKSLILKTCTSDRISLSIIEMIVEVLEAASLNLTDGLRVLSFIFLSGLSAMSQTDEVLARFLDNVKIATPTPYLTPVVSFYELRRDGLQAVLNIRLSAQEKDSQVC